MSLSNWNETYITIKETEHFKVVSDPNRDPRDKEGHGYYLVYKKYNTIEAAANSIVIILSFLAEAEEGYAALTAQKSEEPRQVPVLN